MYPVLIDWGPIFLPSWHVLFLLGALAAYVFMLFLRKRYYPEMPAGQIAMVYFWAYVGGYFGARGFSVIAEQPDLTTVLSKIFALFQLGPMTFYGGFLGAIVWASAYCFWVRLPLAKVADVCLSAGMLGLAYGRIGCFLNGDDYGRPVPSNYSDAWWAVSFPNLGDAVPRYPVQLVESLFAAALVLLSFVMFSRFRSRLSAGVIALCLSLLYALYRFIAEFYRGDPRGELFSGALSPSQYVSLWVIVIVSPLLIATLVKSKAKSTSP